MTVSIIVAIYNGERYMRRCLESLLAQTHSDLEVVCVDDASQDSSYALALEYAHRDARVKVLRHDKNQGPAVARNTALAACTGDVIGYLDCDDWYAPDTVERIARIFDEHHDAGCVLYRCIHVRPDGTEQDYEGMKFESMEGREAFMESLTWNIHGVYAARAELFRQHPYDISCRHFSDDNTTRIHYLNSQRVYQSDAPYYYWENPESISNQVSISRMDYLAANASMKRQLLAMNCEVDVLKVYEDVRLKVVVDSYLFYFVNRKKLSKADRAYCLSEIKKAWQSLDESLLSPSLACKFGFRPFLGSWTLFRLQEELYFFLKKLAGRI